MAKLGEEEMITIDQDGNINADKETAAYLDVIFSDEITELLTTRDIPVVFTQHRKEFLLKVLTAHREMCVRIIRANQNVAVRPLDKA